MRDVLAGLLMRIPPDTSNGLARVRVSGSKKRAAKVPRGAREREGREGKREWGWGRGEGRGNAGGEGMLEPGAHALELAASIAGLRRARVASLVFSVDFGVRARKHARKGGLSATPVLPVMGPGG